MIVFFHVRLTISICASCHRLFCGWEGGDVWGGGLRFPASPLGSFKSSRGYIFIFDIFTRSMNDHDYPRDNFLVNPNYS